MKQSYLMAVLLAAAVAVTGCGKSDNKPAAQGTAPKAETPSQPAMSSSNAATEKLNAYSQAYNSLIGGHFSLSRNHESFQRFVSRAKSTGSSLSLPTVSGLSRAIENFKKGLAVSGGGMGDLDEAVRAVLEPAEKLKARQDELEPYFKSKAYKEDDLAKGKAAFPEMLANYDALVSGLSRVGDLLSKYQRERAEKKLAEYKSSGNMMLYYTEEGMLLAQDLLDVFSDPQSSVKAAESYTKGNDILAKLEATLEAQRKLIEEYKTKGEKTSSFESVNKSLTSFVGSYRELREKKNDRAFKSLTDNYNRAVESYNRAARSRF